MKANLTQARKVVIEESEKLQIKKNEVLLKINYIGICGSDMQMYHGQHKYMTFPVIPGHEAAAEIVEIGEDITDFKIGDKVAIQPQVACGECYPCEIGRFNVCEKLKVLGVHLDGFASEFVALETKYLHKCPDDMDGLLIALVEPLAVGVGAVKRATNYKDSNIVVVGAGTIGNLTAQAAKALGAKNVMITDIVQKKLDYAKKCGIDYCVNTTEKTLNDAIAEHFGKRKADIIIDCAATSGSFNAILKAARRSSSIIITGNYKHPVELELPIIQRQEINMIGHMMYVREDYEDAIKMLNEKTVSVDGFITKTFKLKDFNKAIEYIDNNADDVMKVVIEL